MDPRVLIDASGRINAAQVMRAAHARARFTSSAMPYREGLAAAMRMFWRLAVLERQSWIIWNSDKPVVMPAIGGRAVDGIAHERSV